MNTEDVNKTGGVQSPLDESACSAFIRFRENGTVLITDALCFHSHEYCVYSEQINKEQATGGHSVIGIHSYSVVPKWWQVVKWFKLIQLIRKYASS